MREGWNRVQRTEKGGKTVGKKEWSMKVKSETIEGWRREGRLEERENEGRGEGRGLRESWGAGKRRVEEGGEDRGGKVEEEEGRLEEWEGRRKERKLEKGKAGGRKGCRKEWLEAEKSGRKRKEWMKERKLKKRKDG